jgi:hypothetical protein
MTATRRLITTVLATATWLLVTAAIAAAAPAPVNDGTALTSVPQGPASPPTTTIVNSGSPWWTFVLVAAAAVALTLLVLLAVNGIHRHTTTAQPAQPAH